MRLHVEGYTPLVIPQRYMVPLAKDFGEETPYVSKIAQRIMKPSYRNGKLPVKLLCLLHLKDRMEELGGYQSYNEPLAGVGLSARLFEGEDIKLYLNDFDASCREVLKENFPDATITGDDAFNTPLTPADLIFMDFNNFTLKRAGEKYASVLTELFDKSQKFVIINDCSLFYLRYGAKAFEGYSKLLGTQIQTVPDYLRALQAFYLKRGWHLAAAAYFVETSFLLLSKDPCVTTIKRYGVEDVPGRWVYVTD